MWRYVFRINIDYVGWYYGYFDPMRDVRETENASAAWYWGNGEIWSREKFACIINFPKKTRNKKYIA